MRDWRQVLKCDPLPPLLGSGIRAVAYFVQRDLEGVDPGPVSQLWLLPEAQRILKKQMPDGSWPHPGAAAHPAIRYGLIETFRHLRFLVEQYGFTRAHPQIELAAEYAFSCQAPEGDFRGILANQYATYYTGALASLLVQAGYGADPRLEKVFTWLLGMRQDDGGWSIPMITHKLDRQTQYHLASEDAEPLEPDRSRPFSHNATGMILRAFAAHPEHRRSEPARTAAGLLASRFFQPDRYTSYHAASYWLRFEYPFWWNNLVAALDSVSRIGLTRENASVAAGLAWLASHQEESGLWRVSYVQPVTKGGKLDRQRQAWVTLAICRVMSRLCGQAAPKLLRQDGAVRGQ